MNKCIMCGKQLSSTDVYCYTCKKKLNSEQISNAKENAYRDTKPSKIYTDRSSTRSD